jgi:hypothetical protein
MSGIKRHLRLTTFWTLAVLGALIQSSLLVATIVVIWHFISKYW